MSATCDTHCIGIMEFAFSSVFGAKKEYLKVMLVTRQHNFFYNGALFLAHLPLHLSLLLPPFLITHLCKDIKI